MGLGAEKRLANLTPDDFTFPDPSMIAGKRLLLLDDVITTGTTLHCAAAALRKAGASQVDVITLSRAF